MTIRIFKMLIFKIELRTISDQIRSDQIRSWLSRFYIVLINVHSLHKLYRSKLRSYDILKLVFANAHINTGFLNTVINLFDVGNVCFDK